MKSKLTRKDYKDLELYNGIEKRGSIDLSQNTNRWGVNSSVAQYLANVDSDSVALYPSTYSQNLKEAISEKLNIKPENISTGSGSYDILDTIIRAFSQPGEMMVMADPSLPVAIMTAQMNGLEVVRVPFMKDFSLNETMLDVNAQITYLCSPNNPTGTLISEKQVRTMVENSKGIVIVDEAYVEFSDQNYLDLINEYDNLIILRTFSKAYGLAGLRVGYAVSCTQIIETIDISRGIFKLGALAEQSAIIAYTKGRDEMLKNAEECIKSRDGFFESLNAMSLNPIQSFGNFILLPIANGEKLAEELFENGISVRFCGSLAGIGDAIRITIGPKSEMDIVLAKLRELLK